MQLGHPEVRIEGLGIERDGIFERGRRLRNAQQAAECDTQPQPCHRQLRVLADRLLQQPGRLLEAVMLERIDPPPEQVIGVADDRGWFLVRHQAFIL